jgi:hypothetical protein
VIQIKYILGGTFIGGVENIIYVVTVDCYFKEVEG